MKINLNTSLVRCITPDTYGTGFCHEIADGMWDNFKNLMIEKGKEYLTDALADTDFKDAKLTNFSFHSPKYYNYETDAIDFDIDFNDDIIQTIKEKADDRFFEYARREFGSYSGFISFAPVNPDEFMEAIENRRNKLEYAVAMFISYQIQNALDVSEYDREYIDDVWDYANANGYIDYDEYDD